MTNHVTDTNVGKMTPQEATIKWFEEEAQLPQLSENLLRFVRMGKVKEGASPLFYLFKSFMVGTWMPLSFSTSCSLFANSRWYA